jgi:hypothetical protein
VLTGQFTGPPTELAGGSQPVAWWSPDGSNWHPARIEGTYYGLPVPATGFGPIFEIQDELLAFMDVGPGTGWSGTALLQSLDGGRTWRWADASISTRAIIADVAVGGPGFVAVGRLPDAARGRPVVLTSQDGLNWTSGREAIRFEGGLQFGGFTAVASNGGLLVAVGRTRTEIDAPTAALFWTSTDGLTWAPQPTHPDNADAVEDVTSFGGGFVAVGAHDGGPAAWWSPDGASWTAVEMPLAGGARSAVSVADVEGGLLAVGDSSDHAVAWRSADGIHWEPAGLLTRGSATARSVIATSSGILVIGDSHAPAGPIAWLSPPSSVEPPPPGASLTAGASPAPLVGETPGPEATPWPQASPLPGMVMDDLLALAGRLGMTCRSAESGIPDFPLTYWGLYCEVETRGTHVDLDANYWSATAISDIRIASRPIEDSTPPDPYDDSPPIDEAWFEEIAAAVTRLPFNGTWTTASWAPEAWVRASLHRVECVQFGSCIHEENGVRLVVQPSPHGWVTIWLESGFNR